MMSDDDECSGSDCSNVEDTGIELGFVEKCDPWRLRSGHFPSKVGGFPAWLELKDLPTPEVLTCKKCEGLCVFLCQIYAPGTDKDTCFHRTLFLFVCRNSSCYSDSEEGPSNKAFVALRSQLPRKNPFFAFDPLAMIENTRSPTSLNYGSRCDVCGIRGDKCCAKCKSIHYCSRSHQVYHWKHGHKHQCRNIVTLGNNMVPSGDTSPLLFPEYEIITEAEEIVVTNKGEKECLEEYNELLKSGNTGTLDDQEVNPQLAAMALKEDKQFAKFRHITSYNSKQVVRYGKGMDPLWVSSESVPSDKDIPPCSCGQPRQFEFQVMPQLLNYLNLDSEKEGLDWGTLAVYTCTGNCKPETGYQTEFVWKQDFTEGEDVPSTCGP